MAGVVALMYVARQRYLVAQVAPARQKGQIHNFFSVIIIKILNKKD
jgi:hypothetical protein